MSIILSCLLLCTAILHAQEIRILPTAAPVGGLPYFLGIVEGEFAGPNVEERWQFNAEAQDRIRVRVEPASPTHRVNIRLTNSAGTALQTVNGTAGNAVVIEQYTFAEPGTYTLNVWSPDGVTGYAVRLMVNRQSGNLEREPNNTIAQATALDALSGSGEYAFRVMGALDGGDASGDFFALGWINAGNEIAFELWGNPGGLAPADVAVSLFNADGELLVTRSGDSSERYVVEETASLFMHIGLAEPATTDSLSAVYLLQIAVADAIAPEVVATTLPEGVTEDTPLIRSFSVTFSESLTPTEANTLSHYELRWAGNDGIIGTVDDHVYALEVVGFLETGNLVQLRLVNGSLQPGLHQFSISGNLSDRAGNALGVAYVQTFTLARLGIFAYEFPFNDTRERATPVGIEGGSGWAASFLPDGQNVTLSNAINRIRVGDIFNDGNQRVAVLARSQNQLQLHTRVDGTWTQTHTIATQTNPWDMQLADLNGNGLKEIIVSNRNSHTLSIFYPQPNGTIETQVIALGGNGPTDIAIADLNQNGSPDIVVALRDVHRMAVLPNDGSGGFGEPVQVPLPAGYTNPIAVAAADLDGDGWSDIVVGLNGSNQVIVLWGGSTLDPDTGMPSFEQTTDLGTLANVISLIAGDFAGTGESMIVGLSSDWMNTFPVWSYAGDRTFASEQRTTHRSSGNGYELRAVPAQQHPGANILVSRSSGVSLLTPRTDHVSFATYGSTWFPTSADIADVTGSGLPDLLIANGSAARFEIYPGMPSTPLIESPLETGVRHGFARGRLDDASTPDVWSFEARQGDRLIFTTETTATSSAGLTYQLQAPDGHVLFNNSASSNGVLTRTVSSLPADGIYFVQVSRNWSYAGEYQFHIQLVPAPFQNEEETNNTHTQSQNISFRQMGIGERAADIHGKFPRGDTIDFFRAGNLADGARIRLTLQTPFFAEEIVPQLAVFRGATQVWTSESGALTGDYTVPADGADLYHVRVSSSVSSLLSSYLLAIELEDNSAPFITGDTLPVEGSPTDLLLYAFDVSVNKDVDPARVNDPATWELRGAGPDGVFGTADDLLFTVQTRSTYQQGVTLQLAVTDGPLPPGDYRFTATTALTDLFGNAMAVPYVRTFAIVAMEPFITELAGSDSNANATRLSNEPGEFSGSFLPDARNVGVGNAVNRVRVGDFDGDGHLDMVVLLRGSNVIRFYFGDGAGGWQASDNIATGSNTWDLQVADLNGNGRHEVVATVRGNHTIRVISVDGDRGSEMTSYALPSGANPYELAIADLDGDGNLDLVAALQGSAAVGILLGDGTGAFGEPLIATLPEGNTAPVALAVGDFDGDGLVDVAVSSSAGNAVIFWNQADAFTSAAIDWSDVSVIPFVANAASFAATSRAGAASMRLAGISGNNSTTAVALLTFDGTRAAQESLLTLRASASSGQEIRGLHEDLPGYHGLLVARNGNGTVVYHDDATSQLAYGSFNTHSMAMGDLNGDGLPDLFLAQASASRIEIYAGQPTSPMLVDPDGSGFRHAWGRGQLAGTSDNDHYSFSANAGEVFLLTVQPRDVVGSSGLLWRLISPEGTQLFGQTASSNGVGQFTRTLPLTGTYYLQVSRNWSYFDEYQFRVTLAPADWQVESEANNTLAQANNNAMNFESAGPGQPPRGQVFGTFARGDSIDIFALGNFTEGTALEMELVTAAFDAGTPAVAIYRSGSNDPVATYTTESGDSVFEHQIALDGFYYVGISGVSGGLFSHYQLRLDSLDTIPPQIVGDSLPSETSFDLVDRFTLSFSEEMDAATVNDPANYVWQSSGPDGIFGTGDDEFYSVQLRSTYSGGLLASYWITDGPLQPGQHRLTVSDALIDVAGNPLETAYVREFTVENLDGFVMEGRNSNSIATATPLTFDALGGFDRSFRSAANVVASGFPPNRVAAADFTGDGHADALVLNRNANQLLLYAGDGAGGFLAPDIYGAGPNAWDMQVADLTGNGLPDVVVSNRTGSSVSIYFNVDGVLERETIAVGSEPRGLALADVNGNGRTDIVVAMRASNGFLILRNEGERQFTTQAFADVLAAGSLPEAVAVADFNQDGNPDLVLALSGSGNVAVFFGTGGGQYAAPLLLPVSFTNAASVAVGDLSGNGFMDIVVGAGAWPGNVDRIRALGGEQFSAAETLSLSNASINNQIVIADLDGDGFADLLLARSSGLLLLYQQDGVLLPHQEYGNNHASVAWADFNGDDLVDLLLANQWNNRVDVHYGNPSIRLSVEGATVPEASEYVFARGRRSASGEIDLYAFSARAGQRLMLAVDTPNSSSSSGLTWRVLRPDNNNSVLSNNTASSNGVGTFSPITLPVDGTYYIEVRVNWDYQGEYQMRLNLVSAPWLLESESNNTISTANTLTYALQPDGSLEAKVLGYVHRGDTLDYFNMGNFAAGARIVATLDRPDYSDVSASVSLRNAANQVVANGTMDEPLDFVIPEEGSGVYYLAVSGTLQGLHSVYYLTAAIIDDIPPFVTGDSLPQEFAVTDALIPSFTVDFSEAMSPTSVNNLANIDLRSAGPDGIFGTFDDEVVALQMATPYTTGTRASYRIVAGALQPGLYRLTLGTGFADVAGNQLFEPYVRNFTITALRDLTNEIEPNDTRQTATPIAMRDSVSQLQTGGGRGRLATNSDVDFWSFYGEAGQRVILLAETPGSPSNSGLLYRLYPPTGAAIVSQTAANNGSLELGPIELTQDGLHTVEVRINWGYNGDYHLRVLVIPDDVTIEVEPNNSIGQATPVTLAQIPDSAVFYAGAAGTVRQPGDLDYFDLGEIAAGSTVYLSVRLPDGSPLVPIVALYNADNQYQEEVAGGSINDGVAEVAITATGRYFALVRGFGATHGMFSQYFLDVQVAPTGGLSFPNLVPVSLVYDTGALLSGDTIDVAFSVENSGSETTPTGAWVDHIILSPTRSVGDSNAIVLAAIARDGELEPGARYDIATSVRLPDGIAGNFYIGLFTDATNVVNEFLFEGDNVIFGEDPLVVTRRDYPDLRIESLAVETLTDNQFRIRWATVNRGSADAAAPFVDRIRIRLAPQQTVVFEQEFVVGEALAVDAALERMVEYTAPGGGIYNIEVRTDINNEVFEYTVGGAQAALQNNVATTSFSVTRFFDVALNVSPAGSGTTAGAGTFAEGTEVTVTALPNTGSQPYVFAYWAENGIPRSTQAEYRFVITSNRNLTAVFRLPQFFIGANVSPVNAGSVAGTGFYLFGQSATLTANPQPGYLFENWQVNGDSVTSNPYTFTVAGARTLTAIFAEANPIHEVTVTTQPAGIATLPGAGTYLNGEQLVVSAPTSIELDDREFLFQRWTRNGQFYSNSPDIQHTFTTLEPFAIAFVAQYSERPLRPRIQSVSANRSGVIPAAFDYVLTLQFDRAMDVAVAPVATLLSGDAASVPEFVGDGTWLNATTYRLPGIIFGAGNDGLMVLSVSGARDSDGRIMDAAQPYSFTVDVTAPEHPVPTFAGIVNGAVRLTWTDYAAPADLAFFRIYRAEAPFASLAGLNPERTRPATARDVLFSGLELDTDAHVFVAAVDQAGNMATQAESIVIRIASEVPPALVPGMRLLTTRSVELHWEDYLVDGAPIGLQSFRIYVSDEMFTEVADATLLAELPVSETAFIAEGLDRDRELFFAVVPVNRLGEFSEPFVPVRWTDPMTGTLTQDFTLAEPVTFIGADLSIAGGATLTILPGARLEFAAGVGIEVVDGHIIAEGSALYPVVFTSASATPTAGDWRGIVFSGDASGSVFANFWLNYGEGLRWHIGQPELATFAAAWNAGAALQVSGSGQLDVSNSFFAFNDSAIELADSASGRVEASVIKNNASGSVVNLGSGAMAAHAVWWGTESMAAINATLQGNVEVTDPLPGEPVLASAFAPADGDTVTGINPLPLKMLSLNAESYRISEDSTFSGVVFTDIPRASGDPDLYSLNPFTVAFPLSPEAGEKELFVQFRSFSGVLSPVQSILIDYITEGPVITGYNLVEGQVVTRPIRIEATAESTLPLQSLRFIVGGQTVLQSNTGSLDGLWDIRGLVPGLYRVRLEARDQAGKLAARELNVIVQPQPPTAPVIESPVDGTLVNLTTISVSGRSEPHVTIRLNRGATVVGTLPVGAGGTFSFDNVPLVEGSNPMVATAVDAIGETASARVLVVVNTRPPSGLTLAEPIYEPGVGTRFLWTFNATEDRPTRFRVFIHTADFTEPSQAGFASPLLSELGFVLGGQLPDGDYYAAVVGFDAAGNAGPLSGRVPFILDRTAPVLNIAFDRSSPVGPGPLGITVTANEPLQAAPALSLRSQGSSESVVIPLTTESPTRFTGSFPVNELSARTGQAQFTASARDLAGNRFTGSPSGPALVFDVTRPVGTIATTPAAPISTAEAIAVQVTLSLTKPPAPGETPLLQFFPPQGSAITLTAAGGFAPVAGDTQTWQGTLTLGPDNGSGNGNFTLSVSDAVGNVGTAISSGRELELYNTALPAPPGRPTGLSATTLAGGGIRIQWQAVDRAETYSLYRASGEGNSVPTELLIAGVTATNFEDMPPEDGIYRYIVTASRRGSEGLPSGILFALSDRTPPPAPLNFNAVLAGSGVQISWSAPTGGEVPHRYRVYRNDTLIRTVVSAGTITDAPPRGIMNYRVAATDVYGNEASTDSIAIDLLVGAVADLRVRVIAGNPPVLQWTRPDNQSIGAHIYRNGIRQTATPVSGLMYIDPLGIGSESVEYVVRAVNASGHESAPKGVQVHPLRLDLQTNVNAAGVQRVPLTQYFDSYRVEVSHLNPPSGVAAAISAIELERTGGIGAGASASTQVDWSIAPQGSANQTVVLPAPELPGVAQSVIVRAVMVDAAMGSTVTYQQTFAVSAAQRPEASVQISLGSSPLAGGLTDVTLQFTNRGYVPVDFLVSRNFGQEPGDIYLALQTPEGFEVTRQRYTGVPAGAIVRPNGDVVVTVQPAASLSLTLPDVLIPESMGDFGHARFAGVAERIYHGFGSANVRTSGPLQGFRNSSLVLSPYVGLATVDQAIYSEGGSIGISGQALDRVTGAPVASVPLRIGFASRGYQWFENVTTAVDGSFELPYEPQTGFAGRLQIWAAHPDVVDQLDQASVDYLRLFLTPQRGQIVMSRADTIDFALTLINPGDIALTDFVISSEAFVLDGDDEVPITGLSADFVGAGVSSLAPNERRRVSFRLTAAADLPDNPIIEMRLTSAEGASVAFIGQIQLRPAVALLTVQTPTEGYVEVSVNRGQIISREVTVINQGLRPLENVRLHAPTGLGWSFVNLELNEAGEAVLPDIPVGGTRTFTVGFAPDESVDLGFYSDSLRISGSNAVSDFTLNLFARVTSNQRGTAQFAVDNIFGDPVPNARIRLRNAALRTEVGPINTDASGMAIIEDLQEGDWSWQIAASGHATQTGILTVLPDQVTDVRSMLSRSLVTVNFTVVPKPFTDRYDIIVEQTFETRVPFPVLVMTPPHFEFSNPEPGFETIVIVQAKNEGLIRMIDVEIEGSTATWGDMTPLITYIPELAAQETIEVPFRIRFFGRDGAAAGPTGANATAGFGGGAELFVQSGYGERFGDCLSTLLLPNSLDPNFLLGLAALANANAESFSGALVGLSAAVMIGFDIFNFASTWANPLNVVATVVGCAIGSFISPGGGGGGRGPGGGGGGYGFFGLGCFSAGTPVHLADGSVVPIETVQAGDAVFTDRMGSVYRVAELIRRTSGNLYALTYRGADGRGESVTLQVTGEHRIWTDHAGWVAMQNLEPGQWLHHVDGSLRRVETIARIPGIHEVFTLEIAGDNAFFAGGILVQDDCGGVHQTAPEAVNLY